MKVKTWEHLGQTHDIEHHYTDGHAVQPGRQRPAIVNYYLPIR